MINPYTRLHRPAAMPRPRSVKIYVRRTLIEGWDPPMWKWVCTFCTNAFTGFGYRTYWNDAIEDGLLHLRTCHTFHPTIPYQQEYQSA